HPAVEDLAVCLAQESLSGMHGVVNAAALLVLGDHPLVEPDGGIEIVHAGIHRFAKAAFPELFSHDRLLSKTKGGSGPSGRKAPSSALRRVKRQSRRKKRVLRRCRRHGCRLLLTSARKV